MKTSICEIRFHVWRVSSWGTGWRRLIGSPKLQIILHKRATKYRALLRKMTYKDKGSYESSPPCTFPYTKCLFVRYLASAHSCSTLQYIWRFYLWGMLPYVKDLFWGPFLYTKCLFVRDVVRYLSIYEESICETPFHIQSVYLWGTLWDTFPFTKCLLFHLRSVLWDTFPYMKSLFEESLCEVRCEVRCEVSFHIWRVSLWGTFPYTKCLFVRYVVPYTKCLFGRYLSICEECICEVRCGVSFLYEKSLFVGYISKAHKCSTLQHAAPHCNTLHPTATRCTTLQHAAPHCNTLQNTATHYVTRSFVRYVSRAQSWSNLQHTVPHCNTLHKWSPFI